ncbi:hypothetical protein CHS0354_015976 [Potamilus streckersoni]|uniref:BZIP domain-containing protein n=1 Tax=Potamilus streckersoni TaxID=2493646 RepID=A0AAE0SIP7_9BIVA|nr:hypothetical protein CHS0354_015976 [Potamilus streckersoni]
MFSINGLETMQDYLSQVDLLDRFGLFEGILDDEGLEGSLMGFKTSGPKGSIKSLEIDAPDLLDTFSPSDIDPLNQEWMETLDLSDLLEYDLCGDVISNPILPPQSVQPVQEVQPETNGHQSHLLKMLLTKTSPETPRTPSPEPYMLSISPVQSPVPEAAAVVEQTELSILSIENGRLTDVSNDNVAFLLDSSGVENGSECVTILTSPISQEDIDSILSSSPPTSPSDFLRMGDSSNDGYVEMETESVVSPGSSFECKVSKSKRSRPEPYCIENGHGGRKEKKKVQNKNAATRYRIKKKAEKEALQTDESKLVEKNKDLREKVESLQREISYMKDLMAEIYKAKGFKK